MAVDHEQNPQAYLKPVLNGERLPGTRVVRTSGGNRAMEIAHLQEPSTIGSTTKVVKAKPGTITYRVECVEAADREAGRNWKKWAYRQMVKRRPPATFQLVDLAIEESMINHVVIADLGGWDIDYKTGLWSFSVTFEEATKGVKVGGTAVAKDELDKKLDAVNGAVDAQKGSNAALEKQLNDASSNAGG